MNPVRVTSLKWKINAGETSVCVCVRVCLRVCKDTEERPVILEATS